MQRRAERVRGLAEAAAERERSRTAARQARQQRLGRLDESAEALRARFADLSVASDYDADRLLGRYGFLAGREYADPGKESRPLPCLGPRAHWIDCQKKYAPDSRPCNHYVRALEDCVRKTVGKAPVADG